MLLSQWPREERVPAAFRGSTRKREGERDTTLRAANRVGTVHICIAVLVEDEGEGERGREKGSRNRSRLYLSVTSVREKEISVVACRTHGMKEFKNIAD